MKKLSWRKVKARYRYSVILLRELVRTDFKVRYQGSTLGYMWSLLRPLFMFVILYFIFVYFLHIGKGIPHWPVALLLGMVMWNFFTEITNQGLKAVVNKGGVIRKINFPKYIIILSASISALINLAFNLIVVAIFIYLNHAPLTWWWLMVPVFILEMYIFALGCAFVLSTMYVKFRDINFIWDILLQAAFYASAVLFPISRIAGESALAAKVLLLTNPAAQAIQDARHFLLPATMPSVNDYIHHDILLLVPFFIIFTIFLIGVIYFRKRSPYFAEDI
jgi:ABC-2 type transport system permease protein